MLALQFKNPGTGETLTVGPAPYFFIEGDSLYQGPGGEKVAAHQGWHWQIGQKSFTTIHTTGPTLLRFEEGDGAHFFESVDFVTVIDGGLWLGHENGKLLAKFDEERDRWRVFEINQLCSKVVLAPAPTAS